MTEFFIKLIVLAALAVFTVMDIRKKKVYLPFIVVLGSSGIIWHIAMPGRYVMESVWGILIGMLVYALSRISHEAIGTGDGLVVAACGCWLGLTSTIELFFLALLISAAWAVLLLVRGRGKNQTFPFMPFLLAAQGIMIFSS